MKGSHNPYTKVKYIIYITFFYIALLKSMLMNVLSSLNLVNQKSLVSKNSQKTVLFLIYCIKSSSIFIISFLSL